MKKWEIDTIGNKKILSLMTLSKYQNIILSFSVCQDDEATSYYFRPGNIILNKELFLENIKPYIETEEDEYFFKVIENNKQISKLIPSFMDEEKWKKYRESGLTIIEIENENQ